MIAAEGKIVTAGGIDTHIHWICPQQAEEALVSGVTTMIGGGTGPAAGTNATTCTPGPWYIARMLQAADTLPVNIGLLGKGNGSNPDALREQIAAGAIGLKIHEDWGATPAAINCSLEVAEEMDIQVALHSDTLNESGFVEDTLAAIAGRTIHTFHTEGAGGGHAPDIITACAHPDITEDVAFAESRIRRETIAAEDVLHDIGAFSLTSSDSQAMGRVGEVIIRTWQVAHRMKVQRGALPEETGDNDNFRVKRYVAKYTINPALTHGIAHEVGSIEAGKLADLVVWSPAFFGVKPATIVKGGMIACAPMGDINASIPTPQPVHYRPMFGALGAARHATRLTFVSQAADASGIPQRLGLQSATAVVRGCRSVKKADMIHNDLQPNITVDAQTYEVRVDGELITSEPAEVLPMAQRYFLF